VDGKHYHFCDQAAFHDLIEQDHGEADQYVFVHLHSGLLVDCESVWYPAFAEQRIYKELRVWLISKPI
ncbi:MAG: hypothetical protein AAFU60_16760, partial [Bacteroidota bacterium]